MGPPSRASARPSSLRRELETFNLQFPALAAIVKRVRDSHRGRNGYSTADLVYDVKAACAREAVIFDNDLFNELL